MGLEVVDCGGEPGAAEFFIPTGMRGTEPGPPLSSDQLNRRLVHDLRAPLRALQILPDWIREDTADTGVALPDPLLGHLAMIERQALRMDAFLTGLQELCRLEDPDRLLVQVDLGEALAQAMAETRAPEGFALRTAPVATDQTLAVRAVPGDLLLLLRHLIGNAIRHHDRSDGRVWLRLRRAGSSGIVEVADDGPGIAEADQRRVFEPFTTLRPRDEVEGAGLGLAIAARVTAMLSGRIEIVSPGRGTLVRVRLPLEPSAVRP